MTGTLMFLSSVGPFELAVILVVALLVFGNRLPEVMRALGRSITEFKRGMHEADAEIEDVHKPADHAASPPAPPAGQAGKNPSDVTRN